MKRTVVAFQLALLVSPAAMAAEDGFCGKYRGLVANVIDPTLRGRVQVVVPAVSGDTAAWALPNAPFGRVELPAVGDTVWVAFEACNPQYPIWEGSPLVQCGADKHGAPHNCSTP